MAMAIPDGCLLHQGDSLQTLTETGSAPTVLNDSGRHGEELFFFVLV